MKSLKRYFSLFICLFVLAPEAHAQKKPVVEIHRQTATTKDPSGWYYARSTKGHFSVLLPMPFADFTMIARDTLNKEIKTHQVGFKSDDGFQFAVMEIEKDKTKKIDLRSLIREFNATEIKEEHTAAYSSIFCKIQDTKRYAYIKYVVTDKSMIMMTAECLTPTKSSLDKIYRKFFESLKLY